MPFATITLPDIEQSCARPIIFQVVNQLLDIIGLSKETRIVYKGHADIAQTPGTSIDSLNKDAVFSASRQTFIEVEESYQAGALQETFVHGYEHAAAFADSALEVILAPIYTTSDVSVQIRYRCSSETEAKRWLAQMVIKAAQGREYNLHGFQYTFPIPFALLGLIEDIWVLRENQYGYGDSFRDYFSKCCNNKITTISNSAGKMSQLVVKEKQAQVIARIDMEGIPEKPTKEQDSGTWEIALTYKFSYQRPDGVYIKYPVCVHQQFLDDKYQNKEDQIEDPLTRASARSNSYNSMDEFNTSIQSDKQRSIRSYVRIPEYDDFLIPVAETGTATVLTALCFLDEGRRDIVTLTDLGDYRLEESLIPYLKNEGSNILYHPKSLFYVSVYHNDEVINPDRLEITEDLTIRSKEPLDGRKVYRIRISILADEHRCLWSGIERLSKYPPAMVTLVSSINRLLAINPDFQKFNQRNEVKEWELSFIYWVLTKGIPTNQSYRNNEIIQNSFSTVDGRSFLGGLDRATLQKYFSERSIAPVVMSSSILIHQR